MEIPYDTSTYELTLEPLRSQLVSRGLPAEADITQYNNLYIKPSEKLTHFENYVKNRLDSNSYWEHEQEKKKPKPFIRKQTFVPYIANVDFSRSKFDHETSDYHQNTTMQDVTNIDQEEIPTPRGLINSFLKNDPTEKIKSKRNLSAAKPRIDPKKFFFARPPSSKKENETADATRINESMKMEKTEESISREKKGRKKESILTSSHADANSKANDSSIVNRHSRVRKIIEFSNSF
jgi:hypothetical protein